MSAEETRTLAIELEDKTSRNATTAADSLARLNDKVEKLGEGMDNLVAPPSLVADAFRKLQLQAEGLSDGMEDLMPKPGLVADSFGQLADQADRLAGIKPPPLLSESARLRTLAKDTDELTASLWKLAAARMQGMESAQAAQQKWFAEQEGQRKQLVAQQEAEAQAARKKEQELLKIKENALQSAMKLQSDWDKKYGQGRNDRLGFQNYMAQEKAASSSALPRSLQPGSGEPKISAYNSALQSIGRVFGEGVAGQVAEGARGLAEASNRLGPMMPMLKAGAGLLQNAAVGIAASAAALAIAATLISVKALASVASAGIEASDAKARALAGLGVGGEATRAGVFKVAVELGLGPEETQDFMVRAKRLLSTGFARDQVPVVLKTVANFGVQAGDEKANALATQLEKIQSKGVFNAEAVTGLAEAGVRAELVYKKLAASTGLTIDQVKAKVKTGQLDVQAGIKGILDAANEQSGAAGALAANTVGAKMNGLKTLAGTLFEDVDTGPLKEVLGTVTELFGGPGGAELKSAVTELGGEIFKTLFGPFQGPDGKAKLESLLKTLTQMARMGAAAMRDAAPYVKAFVDLLVGIFGADDKASASRDSGIVGKVRAISDAFYSLITFNPTGYLDALNRLIDMDSLGETIRTGALDLGTALVDGFINGIVGGIPGAVAAAVAMVRGAVDGAKTEEKAHSPSEVTTKLGSFFGQGFTGGIVAHNDNAKAAGEKLVQAATGGAAQQVAGAPAAAAKAAPEGGAGGENYTVGDVYINMPGGGTAPAPQDLKQAIREGIIQALRDVRRKAA